MHLPYTEPREFKGLYAEARPSGLTTDDFLRNDVVKANLDSDGRQYVKDRYDQNLAYVDAEVSRFLNALPDNATVVIMSDHGEEFWDHGGFEHGHTLYDELLRIPMVVRGPGIKAGRFEEPVSILDVTPTLSQAAVCNWMIFWAGHYRAWRTEAAHQRSPTGHMLSADHSTVFVDGAHYLEAKSTRYMKAKSVSTISQPTLKKAATYCWTIIALPRWSTRCQRRLNYLSKPVFESLHRRR